MCLDQRSMRSYAAWKGWQTRRAAELSEFQSAPALMGGVRSPAGSATIPERLAARRRRPKDELGSRRGLR